MEKNNNNLKNAIERLDKRVEHIQRNQMIEKAVANCHFNMVDKIPNDSIFLIDGFNVVRANKHLKKLTKSDDKKLKL